MSTFYYDISLDQGELIALHSILEQSDHPKARYLLDRLYRNEATATSSNGPNEYHSIED